MKWHRTRILLGSNDRALTYAELNNIVYRVFPDRNNWNGGLLQFVVLLISSLSLHYDAVILVNQILGVFTGILTAAAGLVQWCVSSVRHWGRLL